MQQVQWVQAPWTIFPFYLKHCQAKGLLVVAGSELKLVEEPFTLRLTDISLTSKTTKSISPFCLLWSLTDAPKFHCERNTSVTVNRDSRSQPTIHLQKRIVCRFDTTCQYISYALRLVHGVCMENAQHFLAWSVNTRLPLMSLMSFSTSSRTLVWWLSGVYVQENIQKNLLA